MTTLKFKGPFHWDHLISKDASSPCGQNNSLPLPNKPGIYIWGFMYKYDTNKKLLIDPVDFNKIEMPPFLFDLDCENNQLDKGFIGIDYKSVGWKFIPYYVGKASSIYQRISGHRNKGKKINQRYTRLWIEAYKTFSDANQYPVLDSSMERLEKANLILDYIDKFALNNKISPVEYYNNHLVLNNIYGFNGVLNKNNIVNDGITIIPTITNKGTKKGYIEDFDYDKQLDYFGKNPLSRNTSKLNIDSLDFLINKLNNFCFCYAETPSSLNLEFPESQTYYSLKGVTISETKKFKEISSDNLNLLFNIDSTPTCSSIFKKNSEDEIVSLYKFDGYLKDDPYII